MAYFRSLQSKLLGAFLLVLSLEPGLINGASNAWAQTMPDPVGKSYVDTFVAPNMPDSVPLKTDGTAQTITPAENLLNPKNGPGATNSQNAAGSARGSGRDIQPSKPITAPAKLNDDLKCPENCTSLSPSEKRIVKEPQYKPDRFLVPSTFGTPSPPTGQSSTPKPTSKSTGPRVYNNSWTLSAPAVMASRGPGGISLSRAAAEGLSLNISLEGAYVKEGTLVLAGRGNEKEGLNAALIFTALRAACEASDPYFSLDPENGSAWNAQGEQAYRNIWPRVKRDAGWDQKPMLGRNPGRPSELSMRTFSVRNDYPDFWRSMSAEYPDLKSKLVFKPEWLRNTRFGEILFEGDLLLKELSNGVSVFQATTLRARQVAGYASTLERQLGAGLERGIEGGADQKNGSIWQGHRLWFDLAPPKPIQFTRDGLLVPTAKYSAQILTIKKESAEVARLRDLLQRRGADWSGKNVSHSLVHRDGLSLDVSGVYPRMFVRLHDIVANRDIDGGSGEMEHVILDVNRRMPGYAAAYPELRRLIEVFRAYVIAVHATKSNQRICAGVKDTPLLPAERSSRVLPDFHPTELFIAVGSYELPIKRGRRKLVASAGSVNGGVSIAAQDFYSDAGRRPTGITKALNREVSDPHIQQGIWQGEDDLDMQYVAFEVEAGRGLASQRTASLAPDNAQVAAIKPPSLFVNPMTTSDQEWNGRVSKNKGRGTWDQSVDAILILLCLPVLFILFYRPIVQARRTSLASRAGGASPTLLTPDKNGRYPSGAWAMPDQSGTAPPQGVADQPDEDDYASVEREFKNVFAMKSMADREEMIRRSRNRYGGSRVSVMRRLVEEWRKDNRAWR